MTHFEKFKDPTYLQKSLFMLQIIEQNKQLTSCILPILWCEPQLYDMIDNQKITSYIYQLTELIDIVNNLLNIIILDWGKFKKDFHCVNQDKLSHSKLKTLIKDHIFNKHWKISETFVISNSDIYALPFIFPSILLFLLFTSFYPFYFYSALFLYTSILLFFVL